MKCRNCGLLREAHIKSIGERGQRTWKCPDGSGATFPATTDVKIHLHYRAGEDLPWVATWEDAVVGEGQAVARQAGEALEAAGHAIEHGLEEKTAQQKALERAIKE
jgi:hypothetical protein